MNHRIMLTTIIFTVVCSACGKKTGESEAEMRARVRKEERIRLEERQRLQREQRQKAKPMARPMPRKPGATVAPLKTNKGPSASVVLKASTLPDAIRLVKPAMTDTFDKPSPGTIALTIWALKKMKLDAVKSLTQTKHSLVMKDADEERGKGLCTRVRIIEIRAEKSPYGKMFEGAAFVGRSYTKIVRFIAVGSTGTLTAKSRAKLCGVVIGRYSYKNSGGGSSHSVQLVGMFDLKENRGKGHGASAASGKGMTAGKPSKRKKRKSRVFTSRASVSGGLDAATVRRVIRRHLSEIKYCYMSIGLASKPGLAGMVKVSFTITSSGGVGRVSITQSTLNHGPTESCIKRSVRRWRFPRPEGSMPFVTYPFHFKPKG